MQLISTFLHFFFYKKNPNPFSLITNWCWFFLFFWFFMQISTKYKCFFTRVYLDIHHKNIWMFSSFRRLRTVGVRRCRYMIMRLISFIHFQFYMIQMRQGSPCNFRLSLLRSFCLSTLGVWGWWLVLECPHKVVSMVTWKKSVDPYRDPWKGI